MAAQNTPKGMSSRLLTMKFMQRAAATSSPASSPSTPVSDESSSKRRKFSHKRPEQDDADLLVDRQAIQAAIDEGERKREEALVKHAAELGDARWVLNVQNTTSSGASAQKPLQVVQVGYAQIDSRDASGDYADSDEDLPSKAPPIRRYNMDRKKRITEASQSDGSSDSESADDSDSSASDSSDDEDDSDSNTPSAKQRSASHQRAYASKKNAEKARAKEFADKRRKKEVKLNHAKRQSSGGLSSNSPGGGMLSLSSGGRPMQRQSGAFAFSCHNCGEVGHKAADCKKSKQRSR